MEKISLKRSCSKMGIKSMDEGIFYLILLLLIIKELRKEKP